MNLSAVFSLTVAQLEILEKGLTFIPTPHPPTRPELRRDLHTYHRRLKLLDHFQGAQRREPVPFTGPSTWQPPTDSISPIIQQLIHSNNQALTHWHPQPPRAPNISQEHKRILDTLGNIKHIVFKPADKGGQIVIQDRDNYILEALRQLNNTIYYKPLTSSLQLDTQILVRDITQDLHKHKYISTKQKQYLDGPDEPRPRLFYLLPKIHKPPGTWTVPSVVPVGRPIVSDCGSETYNITEYIDHFINPLAKLHPSYIKDTYDFVNKLKNIQVPAHTQLFSIDIDSLYTNIETPLGLTAINHIFKKHPDPSRPDTHILQLLELTLTRNDFTFNNQHYLQLCGCAMGRKYAPAYADIYLAHWEETAFKLLTHRPLLYFRYLDDIFGLWDDTQESFTHFIHILNSHHPKIKIKHTLQPTSVEFLDTSVFFRASSGQKKQLATKVYFKETDRHALLHKSSYHPRHTYRGLIKSQLIRFHRICTFPEHVEEATGTLFSALRPRGYSRRFLRTVKAEVGRTFKDRYNHISPRRADSTLVPLVVTYSETTKGLLSTFRATFEGARVGCDSLRECRLISAHRRNKNLKDILIHSDLNKNERREEALRGSAVAFISLPHIFNPHGQTGINPWQALKPTTSNAVYAIRCRACHRLYVGETKNKIEDRIKQHFYKINNGSGTSVLYTHFKLHGQHNVQSMGLESNRNWTTGQRRAAERKWIHLLKTIDPSGLNEKYN